MVDAVIAGAGIAGIATAWQLAERLGASSTVLVDPRPPLSLTSDRPEANYRDWWPQPAMVELADRSIRHLEALLADGASFDMNRRGYLYVTADEVTAASLAGIVTRQDELSTVGGGAELLSPGVIRSRYPHLSPDIRGAILARRAGSVDTVGLGRAMLDRAVARGARLVRGTVVGVDAPGGRVERVAVATEGGEVRIETARFVDAAGPFAAEVARLVGSELALETVLRQKVIVRDRAGVVPRTAPFTILLDGQSLAWTDAERDNLGRSPDGARLLGPLPPGVHVKPDDHAGPEAIKLGWAWDQTPGPAVADPACPPEFPRQVLLGATVMVPGLGRYAADVRSVVAHDGGFYGRTPDGRPLVGRLAAEGAFVVAGLAGFGAMMACGVGELAATWMLDAEAEGELRRAFDPGRFRDPEYRRAISEGRIATGEL